MTYMKSDRCYRTSFCEPVEGGETGGESVIFSDSQFFPALDGTQIMVDWMPSDESWYVTTQEA